MVFKKTSSEPSHENEKAMLNYLIDTIEEDLAGRNMIRTVNLQPIDHCKIGVLVPCDNPEANADSLDLEDGSDELTESFEKDNNAKAISQYLKTPSSLGFSILVEPESDGIELEIQGSFACFIRVLPKFKEQKSSLKQNSDSDTESDDTMTLAEVCQRHKIEFRSIRFTIPTTGDHILDDEGQIQRIIDRLLMRVGSDPDTMLRFDRIPIVPGETLKSEESFSDWITSLSENYEKIVPPLKASIELRSTAEQNGFVRISVFLCNKTQQADGQIFKYVEDHYNILGDSQISGIIRRGKLHPLEILPVPEDYQFDRDVWAVGHNTSACVDEEGKTITTRNLAKYVQPRLVTQSDPPARFLDLAEKPFDTLESIRLAMRDYAKNWQQEIVDQNTLFLNPDEMAECKKDLDNFRKEIDKFTSGIAALNVEKRLLESFSGMNRVMSRLAKGFDSWRLFQIVFIVSQLPSLVIREEISKGEWPKGVNHSWEDCLDTADVLWFPTGGGKTEAYLGLVSCAILFDRLRGKDFGMTAWLRLPLRMLSMQQLQRAMGMIWETEKERKTILGDEAEKSDPIRLGYLVGSSSTPNDIDQEKCNQWAENPAFLDRLCIIPDCPACGEKGTIEVSVDPEKVGFRHVCKECGAELPLLVSDSEVFRHLPSMVIGTIDKMAAIGFQYKLGVLWNGPRWKCPDHGYSYGKYCFVFGCKSTSKKANEVIPYDPSPAIHIQDELHLLQEELGAFAGHYETLIRYCEEKSSSGPAKIIAATATIEGFEHQVKHLYGVKSVNRFPGRGYKVKENFYATIAHDQNGKMKTQRIFIGFRPSGGNTADLAARCAEIIHERINLLFNNPCIGLNGIKGLTKQSELLDLLYYYSATLTYVGSLHAGTRIKDHMNTHCSNMFSQQSRDFNSKYLNSRSHSGEIAEVIHQIEEPPEWSEEGFLDALVATNMISHGVDLSRANLMIMERFPSQIAEYIQASSRSGRKKAGLVLVILPKYSLRAASIYNRFPEYHFHLDRMVSPVPVNRFAKYAVSRTLPGIVSGLLFGCIEFHSENEVTELKIRANAERFIGKNKDLFLKKLNSAYGLNRGIFDPDLERAMQQAIETQFSGLQRILSSSQEKHLTDSLKPKPMTSLRDVEVGIPFNICNNDPLFCLWFGGKRR